MRSTRRQPPAHRRWRGAPTRAAGRFLALAMAAAAPAQAAPGVAGEPELVDRVVATVNDSTILMSVVWQASEGRLRGLREQYGTLSLDRINQVLKESFDGLIDNQRLAQAAKSFSTLPPEKIEQLVQSEIDQDKAEQVRDFGSYVAFGRALGQQGQTWQSYEADKRVEKLKNFAEYFAIHSRFQQQANLFITPRMLRETYQKHRAMFARPAEAFVAMVMFHGSNARQDAEAAAELWRREPLAPKELARRWPGTQSVDHLRASALKAELAQFGLAGPADRVAVFPSADGFDVARIQEYAPARDDRFEDPAVQTQLRVLCHNLIFEEFRQEAMRMARERTEVFTPLLKR